MLTRARSDTHKDKGLIARWEPAVKLARESFEFRTFLAEELLVVDDEDLEGIEVGILFVPCTAYDGGKIRGYQNGGWVFGYNLPDNYSPKTRQEIDEYLSDCCGYCGDHCPDELVRCVICDLVQCDACSDEGCCEQFEKYHTY